MAEGHTAHPAHTPAYPPGGYGVPARARAWWVAAAVAGVTYGGMLTIVAVDAPLGTPLVGHIVAQPPWKMLMALLLVRAAPLHEISYEWRWLIGATMFSAPRDLWLVLPGPAFSSMTGLGCFLLAHLCYLRVLVGLRGVPPAIRMIGIGVAIGAATGMLLWCWPELSELKGPVTAYVVIPSAMVCTALLACLPGSLTAWGAFAFAASDAMIGISVFVLPFTDHELAIWWSYAAAQLLISAGLLTHRTPPPCRAAA